jgi:hypothetical protein
MALQHHNYVMFFTLAMMAMNIDISEWLINVET